MTAESLLSIRDLTVAIHGQPILNGIDLDIRAGEVVGLVGESGSGKSMTALAAMRLLPAGARATGAVALAGRETTALPESEMCRVRGRDIGMVFQEPMTALNPLQTIGRQVAETVRVHERVSRREADARAAAALERVGLPASRFPASTYPHQLSGGQRQRVVIAMAIVLRPKVLLADEPTTALDVTTQAQILRLIRSLVDEDGMGVLLISHDLVVVAGMAERLAIMRSGAIVEEGETLSVFDAMRHPYTRQLLEASEHAPARTVRPHENEAEAPLLSVESVTRDYVLPRMSLFAPPRRVRAVEAVSFEVRRGENVGLVGESGCGKSTLARAILGLEAVQSGSIRLDGRPFADARSGPDSRMRRQVQAVFQDPYGSFNPRHRVERLVAEPLHLVADAPRGAERRHRVEQALTEVGLEPAAVDRYVHEFSGGQRQRLAIARALIIEPALIVLDEAVSALDVSVRAQILDVIAGLSDRLAVSFLFISHDLSVVRAITDRVLVMQAGRIVEQGKTAEIFADPQHAYTRQLLAATPRIDAALAERRNRS